MPVLRRSPISVRCHVGATPASTPAAPSHPPVRACHHAQTLEAQCASLALQLRDAHADARRQGEAVAQLNDELASE
eukprot:180102-Chlamydomonas_euryale.AAC.1